jgi:hypothetical protein
MKKSLAFVFVVVCLGAVAINFSSCGKEKSLVPNISFLTDTTRFILNDTALIHGTVFNVGIQASKTGTEAYLSSLTITRSLNGESDSIIQQADFVQRTFYGIYTYKAPDSGSVARYTFTVDKQDGITNSIGLTITGR